MRFWKDKQGNELNFKQFIDRWKKGVEGVTPLQQVNVQINSTYIMISGIGAGFFITLFDIKTLWWLSIILFGALGNTYMQLIGLYQKRFAYENQEKLYLLATENYIKGGNEDE